MAFSHATSRIAFVRAEGQCECVGRRLCNHTGRCLATFDSTWRASEDPAAYGWMPHQRYETPPGRLHSANDCEILCLACHANARRFGDDPAAPGRS